MSLSPLPEPHWTQVPKVARIVDYFTGGTDNYAADRALAHRLRQTAPWLPQMLLINRQYSQRAVEYMSRVLRIGQFLDLGYGMPHNSDAHPLKPLHTYDAASLACTPRVVYVHNSRVVHGHAKTSLAEHAGTAAIHTNAREVGRLMDNKAVASLIDINCPVAALCDDLLCWMTDEDAAWFVADLHDRLPPGSAISVSHATTDTAPEVMGELAGLYAEHGIVFRPRSRDHIGQLLGPWTPVAPGLVTPAQWPTPPDHSFPGADQSHAYAAVALHRPAGAAPAARSSRSWISSLLRRRRSRPESEASPIQPFAEPGFVSAATAARWVAP
ncbi:SAM-dependent methyltransferase [Streptomyces sp. MMS24-I29]|uniref:SAM-dependent methyltransferase n=1 Tax=Streptomyces sp. MMS24-I29 TaxID=3351480 RepID=UPI003C7B9DFB